jgi:alkylated DNA nucleotide flippase Atl1
MKPDLAPRSEPASPTRVEFQVRFSLGPKGRRRVREAPVEAAPPKAVEAMPKPQVVAPTESIPKITRLLVLAHHFERLVRDGTVKDYADIARLTGLTRARVTQIVNLTLLAPEIQDAILRLPPGGRVTERDLRPLVASADWRSQRALWKALAGRLTDPSPR